MKKVVLLHNAVAPLATEADRDTLVQVEAVDSALKELGYETSILPLTFDLSSAIAVLERERPDFVFNLVEAIESVGKFLHFGPCILDYVKIPYTGCKTDTLFITTNKLLSKQILKAANIFTPAWVSLHSLQAVEVDPCQLYIIKSISEDASTGLDEHSVAHFSNRDQLYAALLQCSRESGGEWFAEHFIEGREFNLSLFPHGRILPVAEIKFDGYPKHLKKFVSYRAKWIESSVEYQQAERTFDFSGPDDELLENLREIGRTCWNIFEISGYARVDIRIDALGQPWVLEVNANPCIAPDSGCVAAAKQAGLNFIDVIQEIISDLVYPL